MKKVFCLWFYNTILPPFYHNCTTNLKVDGSAFGIRSVFRFVDLWLWWLSHHLCHSTFSWFRRCPTDWNYLHLAYKKDKLCSSLQVFFYWLQKPKKDIALQSRYRKEVPGYCIVHSCICRNCISCFAQHSSSLLLYSCIFDLSW